MAKLTNKEARLRRHRRIRRWLNGTADVPRLCVFRSDEEIYAQVIDDEAQHTLAAASTLDRELRSDLDGKTKSEQATLVGELVAKRAMDKGIKSVVFDRGGNKYIGRVKALADGARKAGLEF
ncbi:MAG: 50S ribosomal protein L18 [Anaerolineae bacterium]|jgi:large subunit ribosomal protein L18|nr:50S ribosomal protein L18 [Anaerolineae bacterium]